MRRACVLLGMLALLLGACGKYGAPVRSRPSPPPATAQASGPATVAPGAATPDPTAADPTAPDEKKQEPAP